MDIPQKIRGYKSKVINQIIDALQAMKLSDSPDHRKVETSNGVILHNVPKKTTHKLLPFELYWLPGLLCIRNGQWYSQGRLRTANVVDPDDEYIDVETGTLQALKDYWVYIYLEYDNTTKYSAFAKAKDSTALVPPFSLPEPPTQPTDTETLLYKLADWQLIGEFSTDADKKIINIKNWTMGPVLKSADDTVDSILDGSSSYAYKYGSNSYGSIDYAADTNDIGHRLELRYFSKGDTIASVLDVKYFVIRYLISSKPTIGYLDWFDLMDDLDGRYEAA